mgnify:FL=1
MVKLFFAIFLSVLISNKVLGASNNLFFTSAQLISYCKSDNLYEQGICDGYIIAVNDVIYSIDQKKTNLCIPQNLSIKNIRLSIINFIIDNAELMSVEANKVVGKFFVNDFGCNN